MGRRGFGDLEAVIMDRVWALGAGTSTTVRALHDALATERDIAYTTVMSTMDNLHTKGWLARERDGKAYRYWATLTREEHSARLMREAFDAGGRRDLVLSYFLDQLGPDEAARLRAALHTIERRGRFHG